MPEAAAPDLDKMPEGAAMADPAAPLETQPVYAPHNMRLDNMGNLRGYGDPDNLEGDAGLAVEFYVNAIDGLEHVKISAPGERNMEYDYLAKDGKPPYIERFARQYAAFKNEESQFAGQTLLRDVAWLDDATRNGLRANNVHTLEQLAAVTDTGITAIGPGTRKLRDRAAEVVANRSAAEDGAAMRKELADLRAEIAELRRRRGGRPPKNQAA